MSQIYTSLDVQHQNFMLNRLVQSDSDFGSSLPSLAIEITNSVRLRLRLPSVSGGFVQNLQANRFVSVF